MLDACQGIENIILIRIKERRIKLWNGNLTKKKKWKKTKNGRRLEVLQEDKSYIKLLLTTFFKLSAGFLSLAVVLKTIELIIQTSSYNIDLLIMFLPYAPYALCITLLKLIIFFCHPLQFTL